MVHFNVINTLFPRYALYNMQRTFETYSSNKKDLMQSYMSKDSQNPCDCCVKLVPIRALASRQAMSDVTEQGKVRGNQIW
jgi:hypothetical protein